MSRTCERRDEHLTGLHSQVIKQKAVQLSRTHAAPPVSPSLGRARPLGITRSMPLCTNGSTRGGGPPEAAAEATSQPTPFLRQCKKRQLELLL